MKRSPNPTGRIPAPIVVLLALSLLALLLLPAAAAVSTQARQDACVLCGAMCDGENGRVTDTDGHIGNNSRGADHTPTHDGSMREKIKDLMPGDGAMTPRDGTEGELPGSMEDGTAGEMSSSGILPWIIGSLVVLAVILVVLALLPRRGKSH